MFFLLGKIFQSWETFTEETFFFFMSFVFGKVYLWIQKSHFGFIMQPFKQISIFWIFFYLKKHVFVWRYSNDAIDLFYYP